MPISASRFWCEIVRGHAYVALPGDGERLRSGSLRALHPVSRTPAEGGETPSAKHDLRRASKLTADGLSEEQVRRALQDLDPLWDELFPAEQARLVQLLVERVDVGTQGFDLRLRVDGLASLAKDLSGGDGANFRQAA